MRTHTHFRLGQFLFDWKLNPSVIKQALSHDTRAEAYAFLEREIGECPMMTELRQIQWAMTLD